MKGTIIPIEELAELCGQSQSNMSVEISEIFNKIIYRLYKSVENEDPDMVDVCSFIIEETGITTRHLYDKLDERNMKILKNDAIKRKEGIRELGGNEQTVDEVLL